MNNYLLFNSDLFFFYQCFGCVWLVSQIDLRQRFIKLKQEFITACKKSKLQPPKLNYHNFEQGLAECDNDEFKAWILQGVAHGFDIGFEGAIDSLPKSTRNHTMSIQEKCAVLEDVINELKEGRMIAIPDVPDCVSPLGCVPKDETKFRVIRNYSSPEGSSLNDHINDRFAKVKYVTHQQIAQKICEEGSGCCIAKVDLKSAFRQIPVSRQSIRLLGHKLYGQYVAENRVPFGLRSACLICQGIGLAIILITNTRLLASGLQGSIANFVDDFICIKQCKIRCQLIYDTLLNTCKWLGVEVNTYKCASPATRQVILGLQYDTQSMRVCLPDVKVQKYTELINITLRNKYIAREQLASLIGKLTYAAVVIFPGTAFLQYLRQVYYSNTSDSIFIDAYLQKELQWWLYFFNNFNGISIHSIANPPSPSLTLATDASNFGFGAVFEGRCFGCIFGNNNFMSEKEIVLKELYACAVAIATWAPNLNGNCLRIFMDSKHAKAAIMCKRDKNALRMSLVRYITVMGMKYKFSFFVEWLPSKSNDLADSLSRMQFQRFNTLCSENNMNFEFVEPVFDDFWSF